MQRFARPVHGCLLSRPFGVRAAYSVFHEDKWWMSTVSEIQATPRNSGSGLAVNDLANPKDRGSRLELGAVVQGRRLSAYCTSLETIHGSDDWERPNIGLLSS